jgi:hypothetical protein
MKRNAKIQGSVLAVFFLCTAGVALGQRQGAAMDPEQMADRMVATMKDRLNLTDEQVTKVKPIITDSMKRQADIRQKYGAPQPGQRPSPEAQAEMKKSREMTNKQLSGVLTKDQMQEYNKMISERRPGGGYPPQK